MELYVLVDTSDRETGIDVFRTEVEARSEMVERYNQKRSDANREEGDRCELHYDFAWLNDHYGYDYDWSIHMIETPT